MPCIFCRSKDDLTDEHVFPAFMGGKLVVVDGSCTHCNGDFSKAEGTLKQSTVALLNLLRIKNRRGRVPRVRVRANVRGLDMKNLPAFIDEAGEIELYDTVTQTTDSQGKLVRNGFFVTKESGDKFAERARAQGGHVIERDVPEQIVIEGDYSQPLRFAFSLEARKIAAKIALTAIAFEYGVPYSLDPQFDDVRKAGKATGNGDLRVWIFANAGLISANLRTAHEHSVICYLSAEWRRGWALVTLFGGITYRVDVATSYKGREKMFSVFYDAVSRKRIFPIILADERTLVGHVLSPATKFEDRDALDAQWFPIVESSCARKGLVIERIRDENT